MLSVQLTNIVLYSAPFLSKVIDDKKSKLHNLFSFDYNEQGCCADVLFDFIFATKEEIEMLMAMRNVIDVALSHLTEKERVFVKEFFFKRLSYDVICLKYNTSRSTLFERKSKVIKKLRTLIEILGFSEAVILKYFNNSPLFIASAEYAVSRKKGESNGKF